MKPDDVHALIARLESPSYWKSSDGYSETFNSTPSEAATALRELLAEVERKTEALEFYADKSAWNQPPVKTIDHPILGPAYENQASMVQRDRGEIARKALETNNDG